MRTDVGEKKSPRKKEGLSSIIGGSISVANVVVVVVAIAAAAAVATVDVAAVVV